ADEEGQAEDGAPRVELNRGPADRPERDRLPLPHLDRVLDRLELLAAVPLDALLDLPDDPLGLLLLSVDEEPARALGHVPADEHDREGEHGAEPEGDPPADVL